MPNTKTATLEDLARRSPQEAEFVAKVDLIDADLADVVRRFFDTGYSLPTVIGMLKDAKAIADSMGLKA
jgi:hypothetical protein